MQSSSHSRRCQRKGDILCLGFLSRRLQFDKLAGSEISILNPLVRRPSSTGLPAAAEVAQADLADGRGLDQALAGIDTVIHLAGATKALSADGYYAANREAAATLAAALAGRAVRHWCTSVRWLPPAPVPRRRAIDESTRSRIPCRSTAAPSWKASAWSVSSNRMP